MFLIIGICVYFLNADVRVHQQSGSVFQKNANISIYSDQVAININFAIESPLTAYIRLSQTLKDWLVFCLKNLSYFCSQSI